MRTMLLSFKPHIYEKIRSGQKIFEHRRSFPDEPIKAYMYVSSPVCSITGFVMLGKRHKLSDWKNEFAADVDAVRRITEYEKSALYAMEIKSFQETTAIPLSELRENIEGFVAPQMYYYLDGKPLLEYIERRLQPKDVFIEHDFKTIVSDQICRH